MIESIGHHLERFPEDEMIVFDLIGRDPTFAALCRKSGQMDNVVQQLRQEHAYLERELGRLRQRRTEVEAELERGPQRREQIEDEWLTGLEGYTPQSQPALARRSQSGMAVCHTIGRHLLCWRGA